MPNKRFAVSRMVFCVICGNEFLTNHSQGKYCSDDCRRIGARKSWVKYGEKNRQKRRDYHNALYETNKEKVIERTKAYHQTQRGRESQITSFKNQCEKYPDKYRARQAVSVAIRKGALKKQPCERCGATRVHAHHEDYSNPLDVIWLCSQCHIDVHKIEAGEVAAVN